MTGTLLLVPNTLDLGAEAVDIREVLSDGVLRRAAALKHWVAEDARTTRAFLKRVAQWHPLALPLQQIDIRELPRPRKGGPGDTIAPSTYEALLRPALDGHDLGLISEAGLPGVADPGAALVAAAHACALPVQPLPGASALMLALAASGLDGQSFAFVGYLPQDAAARAARLRELEGISRKLGQTQLMIETPYRNVALLHAMLATLGGSTRVAVSCGLTLAEGFTRCGTVSQWREWQVQLPTRRPAVFAMLAP
jgi:16S rRNA (cytidine1402-2'-O)-methyltransferase